MWSRVGMWLNEVNMSQTQQSVKAVSTIPILDLSLAFLILRQWSLHGRDSAATQLKELCPLRPGPKVGRDLFGLRLAEGYIHNTCRRMAMRA